MRDIRTVNCTEGQKLESDEMMKRIGDISYRNLGTIAKTGLFDDGKALIVGDGLRVEASSGMTVSVPSGAIFQRFIDVIPCIQPTAQTITLDAATGVSRTDIIEAQVKVISDKTDYSQVATVASGTAIAITNEEIKRDIKYYLSARKQTDTTTATVATAGTLTGTVAISGTLDLSDKYLLNLSDGEDGAFQEIDCRGATPAATTKTEIINAINSATGRTMASAGGGDVIVLTGEGTGQTSYFTIKPVNTDSDKDCLEVVFGVSVGGVYKYSYEGTNEWFKIAEIDVGTVTTVITTGLIRNIDEQSTWTGSITDIIVRDYVYKNGTVSGLDADKVDGYDVIDDDTLSTDASIGTAGNTKAYISSSIASTAEAIAGTDDTVLISPLKMREGFNAAGSAPVYACRAWVNFNGTGTVAIRDSGNVSSITDGGVGNYTINFTVAMEDVNYCPVVGLSQAAAAPAVVALGQTGADLNSNNYAAFGTGSLKIVTGNPATSAATDPEAVCVSIFR